jgi:hypothetical protein
MAKDEREREQDEAKDFNLAIDAPALDPGSPEALANGCTCDPVENHHGKGEMLPEGRGPVFCPDNDCPLHGLETIAKLLDDD